MHEPASDLPVIDVGPLLRGDGEQEVVARALDAACRRHGFFYMEGHGVSGELLAELEAQARDFFRRPLEEKLRIRMELGGRAWRGYFPVGGELTSGRPDHKEGLYFGIELGDDDPRVRSRTPLHGSNLFPAQPDLRSSVQAYMAVMTELGRALVRGLALALGLPPGPFVERYARDPLTLFRIFAYPPTPPGPSDWGVAEHTDYGLLTILHQDRSGGLEVRTPSGWIAAPPRDGAFVCNIGDMLERATAGTYRSTPHRVRHGGQGLRLSFPFFFDPPMAARVEPIAATDPRAQVAARWDDADVHLFEGTYGDYLLAKIGRVFPDLGRGVL